MEGNRIIPGCSTVNFDEISKKRIFDSIDKANFNDIKLIKENYNSLKQKLGKMPRLSDFNLHDSIDPIRIFDNNSLGSYHKFLTKYEKEYMVQLSSIQESFIEFISKKLASGKRIHELEMIRCTINYKVDLTYKLRCILKEQYDINFKHSTETSIVNVLTNQFASGTAKATYKECIFLEKYGLDYKTSEVFIENLKNKEFKEMIEELIQFGIDRYKKFYSGRYMNTGFELYQKYTYEDVCILLGWEKGEVALNIGGYKFDKNTKPYPGFINYNKSQDISDSINYEDRFESSSQLIAISKQGRTEKSPDVVQAYSAEKDGVEMNLFVRKDKNDKTSKEFYYLGKIKAIGTPKPIIMGNTNKTAVEIKYQLYTPVREDIYEYIIS